MVAELEPVPVGWPRKKKGGLFKCSPVGGPPLSKRAGSNPVSLAGILSTVKLYISPLLPGQQGGGPGATPRAGTGRWDSKNSAWRVMRRLQPCWP